MIEVFDSFDDMNAHLQARRDEMHKDFLAHAAELGLDPAKPYEFLCLSFERELITEAMREELINWATGLVRGYINQFGTLCLNLPVKPEEGDEINPEDDILGKLQAAGQEYHDLESANWECWRVSFPSHVHNLGELICLWNYFIESRRQK